MASEEDTLLEKRKADFDGFYRALMPGLVDFVGKMGINPAHEVLRHAVQYVGNLSLALQGLAVGDAQDRSWLIMRVGYFIGEYFVQKFGGCWYVNDIRGSRYFARYVVGKFSSLSSTALMLDPFYVAQVFVDTACPRNLEKFLAEVESELIKTAP